MASEKEQAQLVERIVNFLRATQPTTLMLSGRRSDDVAKAAEKILREALRIHMASKSKLERIVTGCAEGVDMIAFPIAQQFHLKVVGHYTPTIFARPSLTGKHGIARGPSPLASIKDVNKLLRSLKTPPHEDRRFPQFLELMEGQWQARDTLNAEKADVCIGFVDTKDVNHDGTKATLNIFANGTYKFPNDPDVKFNNVHMKNSKNQYIGERKKQLIGTVSYNVKV